MKTYRQYAHELYESNHSFCTFYVILITLHLCILWSFQDVNFHIDVRITRRIREYLDVLTCFNAFFTNHRVEELLHYWIMIKTKRSAIFENLK